MYKTDACGKAERSEVFENCGLEPKMRFTAWNDCAILSTNGYHPHNKGGPRNQKITRAASL